jgi:murein DD-endopeptidase MepM/ murein hydrolase activator NlpD
MFLTVSLCLSLVVNEPPTEPTNSVKEQTVLFQSIETLTGVPWEYLAAMDRFEEKCKRTKKTTKEEGKTRRTAIQVHPMIWAGMLNPNPDDTNPKSISFFGGIGQDANGDGKANPLDDLDVLYSIACYLAKNGTSEEQLRQTLWEYYHEPTTVDIISHTAKLFAHFQKMDLNEYVFPLPIGANYTYRDTWGDRRGWGGLRIHEGTDIFASYGTPVKSTCYGYVELIGWNPFGGWRVGIRDANDLYHYFAHLQGFRKDLKKGSIVKPGEVIGWVGASGYGPPGTSGKFPPHLHYGIYRFNGKQIYSFDPYPLLKKWEKKSKQNKQKGKKPISS